MVIKARFDGRVFVPDQPVDLPVGFEFEIAIPTTLPTPHAGSTLQALAQLAASLPENANWPADKSAQHDHYLYGAPKRP